MMIRIAPLALYLGLAGGLAATASASEGLPLAADAKLVDRDLQLVGHHRRSCDCAPVGAYGYSGYYGPSSAGSAALGYPAQFTGPAGGAWPPGGYEARVGSPYYYSATAGMDAGLPPAPGAPLEPYVGAGPGTTYGAGWGSGSGDPYTDHFGPGFHRHSLQGHYRFPYYSYRRPWYFPGHAVYNRDTNFAW